MNPVPSDKSPQHSPKLKMAAMEIKAVLDKYDIAGIAHLHEPGFNEFLINISTSFSCVAINDANHLQITPPLEDPEQPNAHKKKIADTINMMANLKMHTMRLGMILQSAEATIRQKFGIMPKKGGPHIQLPKNGLS